CRGSGLSRERTFRTLSTPSLPTVLPRGASPGSVPAPARARLRASRRRLAAWLAGCGPGAGLAARRGARVLVGATHAQLLSGHPHLLQVLEHLARHALGQVDQAVVVADVDAADEAAFQVEIGRA